MKSFGSTWFLFLVLAAILSAPLPLRSQVGPKPGSGRRNYPLGGLGFPVPDLPQVNYQGTLKDIKDKWIFVTLDDGRTANFQRDRKTKFYKHSTEIKASAFIPGERISIDALEDPQAFLTAVRVSDEVGPPPARTVAAAPRQRVDDLENGRPTLRRRPDTTPDSETPPPPAPSEQAEAMPPPDQPRLPAPAWNPDGMNGASNERNEPDALTPPNDPLLEKARGVAEAAASGLPDFACQASMSRYLRDGKDGADWKSLDTVSTELSNRGGQMTFRNVKLNNAAADIKDPLAGSWSIARLLSAASELFSEQSAARFSPGGATNLPGLDARVYDFNVDQQTSQWLMQIGDQSISAPYAGTVYIDRQSGRILRLEMETRQLPANFPIDRVETDVEYDAVTVGGASVVLPMHVETTGCQRETHACSRSIVDFRNFRDQPHP